MRTKLPKNSSIQTKTRTKWRIRITFCIVILLLFILSSRLIDFGKSSINIPTSLRFSARSSSIKYLFNIGHWRDVLIANRNLFNQDQSSWCDVPQPLKRLSSALCQIYWRRDCSRLPCYLIHNESKTLQNIQCLRGGKPLRDDRTRPDFLCKRGFTLDLFLSQNSTYPSIIADSLMPMSDELYFNVLNSKFRHRSSIWGLYFNFESISNYPSSGNRKYLDLFDIKFGYDRHLYDVVPAPWLFNYVDQLLPNKRRLSWEEILKKKTPIPSNDVSNYSWVESALTDVPKDENQRSDVKAPVLWMNSNCHTPSKRTEFMTEFMKYIDVDNYGTCGRNIRPLPNSIANVQGSNGKDLKNRGSYKWEDGKVRLASEYLFTVAIENSVNHDYITEKLWHAFIAGSVPIYLGAPNIDEWLPCSSNCIIDLRKFTSAKDAAAFVRTVATNRTLYESYHQWRSEPIPNHFQKLLDYFQKVGDYNLDCILCDMSHRIDQGEQLETIKSELLAKIGRF